MKFMLMHSLCHCSSVIIWLGCIMTAFHTTTASLLVGDILQIGIETFWLATCVPREVH